MKKICIGLIVFCIGIFFLIIRGYDLLKETTNTEILLLKQKIEIINENRYKDSFENAIIMLNNPKVNTISNIVTANTYFLGIYKGDTSLLSSLNTKSLICSSWSSKTMDMYKNYFIELDDLNSSVFSLEETLNGVKLVNKICLTSKL